MSGPVGHRGLLLGKGAGSVAPGGTAFLLGVYDGSGGVMKLLRSHTGDEFTDQVGSFSVTSAAQFAAVQTGSESIYIGAYSSSENRYLGSQSGASWQAANGSSPTVDSSGGALAFDSAGFLYRCGGNYPLARSSDGGNNFQVTYNAATASADAIVVAGQGRVVLAASSSDAVTYSDDQGSTFSSLAAPADKYMYDPSMDRNPITGTILLCFYGGRYGEYASVVARSVTNGASWSVDTTTVTAAQHVAAVRWCWDNTWLLLTQAGTVYVSTDDGVSWVGTSQVITSKPRSSATNGQVLMFLTNDGVLWAFSRAGEWSHPTVPAGTLSFVMAFD